MDRPHARINRTGLLLLGVILAAAGGAGLARGVGAFGDGRASAPVLTGQARRFADDHAWFWPAVAAVAVVLALLGLAWMLTQLRSSRLQGLSLEPDDEPGETRVEAKAITDALEAEIGEYPGVRRARALLIGSSKGAGLRLSIAYGQDADPAELRRRIQDDAVPRLCAALERESIPTVVRLRLTSGERAATVI
ncbi:alkaline shock response membrane anchor protein AmaP [Actinomadura chokoriensis]